VRPCLRAEHIFLEPIQNWELVIILFDMIQAQTGSRLRSRQREKDSDHVSGAKRSVNRSKREIK